MTNRSINHPPVFSVITPSYNMLNYLPMCCASVSDQNVACEHIVVDAGSVDGTVEWLKSHPDIISISESDAGMYDAINKGIKLSSGEIISYLNCDEQYLLGVLRRVKEIFDQNPQIDILFGNAILIDPNGELLSYRKGFAPRWTYIWASHMYVHASSMFVRRRVFDSGLMFDKNWKMIGDGDFVVKVLRKGFFALHVGEYFSSFMITNSNLGDSESAHIELIKFRNMAPQWLRYSSLMIRILIRVNKLLNGAYWERMPLSYLIYTPVNLSVRSEFTYTSASPFNPTWWKKFFSGYRKYQ